MLDIKFIRENTETVKRGVFAKNFDPKLVDKVLKLDEDKRKLQTEIESLRSERNKTAKSKDFEKGKEIKKSLQEKGPELDKMDKEFYELLKSIPNIAAEDVKVGKDESENEVLRQWGTPRKFNFKIKDHIEIGEELKIINIEKATKITGTRFGYLMGDAALMEYALVQLVFQNLTSSEILKSISVKLDKDLSSKPFIPVVPPVMIKPEVFDKMSRLNPKEERYFIPSDNLYLIGSAEHTLGPIHMDETISENDLPARYIGFSTAFRREAGSYGKDTRGILRVHEFDKIEIESFTLPEYGRKEQDFIVAIQEYLMQMLNLPYQVIGICTGDMGGPDFRQIDINTWLPGQNQYRETHTSDYMTDYQARRLNSKFKRKNGETGYIHMNDATVFAIGRTIIAILENYQNEDGSVTIPEALRKWMGKEKIEKK